MMIAETVAIWISVKIGQYRSGFQLQQLNRSILKLTHVNTLSSSLLLGRSQDHVPIGSTKSKRGYRSCCLHSAGSDFGCGYPLVMSK